MPHAGAYTNTPKLLAHNAGFRNAGGDFTHEARARDARQQI
jgi:hypothetical protein